jgi:hypothetical protein
MISNNITTLLETYGNLELVTEENSYQYMLHASWGHPRPVRLGARSVNENDALKYLLHQVASGMFMTCNVIEEQRK